MSGMLMGDFVLTVRLTQPAELPTNIGLFSEQNSIYYHILYFLFHPSLLLLYFDEKVVRYFIYYNTRFLILDNM